MRKLEGWAATLATAITIAACGGGGSGSGAGGGGAGGGGAGGSGPSCGDTPTQCPAGQTCWFAPDGGFECETSGAGQQGDECAPTKGQPTCADGLLCVQEPMKTGACAKLCDTGTNPCGDLVCTPIQAPDGSLTHDLLLSFNGLDFQTVATFAYFSTKSL